MDRRGDPEALDEHEEGARETARSISLVGRTSSIAITRIAMESTLMPSEVH